MYTGPNIITNGLVMYLDAGNSKSYTSGSTTWRDVSRNNNSGSLVNGPTFSSGSGGSIVFNGTTNYVGTSYILSNSAASIVVWFKATTQTSNAESVLRPIIQQGDFTGTALPEGIEINMFRTGYVDVGKIRFAWGNATGATYFLTTTNRYDNNNWYMASVCNNGTTFTVYINAISVGTALTYSSVSTVTNLQIGGSTTLSARKFAGSIANLQLYNRALSAQEVLQNYNATKARFGL